MKKLIAMLCTIFAMIFTLSACGTNGKNLEELEYAFNSSRNGSGNSTTVLPYTSYNLEAYVQPYWTGNIVYNENIMFIGQTDSVPLMYPAEEIISVRSYDLGTEYKEGVDYNYDKFTNRITLTSGSSMKYFPYEWYYPTDEVVTNFGLANATPNANGLAYFDTVEGVKKMNGQAYNESKTRIIYSEALFNTEGYQFAVTYRHKGDNYIKAPAIDKVNFESQLNAVKSKHLKILFYGDSVTVGCNAGATNVMNWPPYMPNWATMTYQTLVNKYSLNAEYKNLAVGGWTSLDGSTNTVSGESSTRFQQVLNYAPDIMFLGFGLNDVNFDTITHIKNLETIARAVLNVNPNCIFILVGSYLPHPEVWWVNQEQLKFPAQYPSLAASLARDYGHHIFVANVMPEHASILERKRYCDGTSNNVNHPNDFICRLYAQTILYTLCGDYTA